MVLNWFVQEGRQSDHASQLGVFHAVHESALEGGLPLEAFHAAALLKELPKLPNGSLSFHSLLAKLSLHLNDSLSIAHTVNNHTY